MVSVLEKAEEKDLIYLFKHFFLLFWKVRHWKLLTYVQKRKEDNLFIMDLDKKRWGKNPASYLKLFDASVLEIRPLSVSQFHYPLPREWTKVKIDFTHQRTIVNLHEKHCLNIHTVLFSFVIVHSLCSIHRVIDEARANWKKKRIQVAIAYLLVFS